MEFVRPGLGPRVLPAAVEYAREGEEILVAGWPILRQHPRGQDGTVFVTIEDETGDALVPSGFTCSTRAGSSWAARCCW